MAREYTDARCPLHASRYCTLLNMPDCGACTVRERAKSDPGSVQRDLDALSELVPEPGLASLFLTDECVLCKTEAKGGRDWYAMTDLGNAKTAAPGSGGGPLGIRLKGRAGFVLPIQMACCDACRKRFLRLEYVPVCVGAAIALVAVVALGIRPINEALAAVAAALPAAVFLLISAAGLIAGALLRKRMLKRYACLTHLDVFELGILRGLQGRGWFPLYKGKGAPAKLIFSKKRLRSGVYTGNPEYGRD